MRSNKEPEPRSDSIGSEEALAVIVAHGSPSDPEPVDRFVKALAERVGAIEGAWRVTGATLAKPGSLDEALDQAADGVEIAVYPFFMSDGWFVGTELRRRVAASTGRAVTFLDPFGLDPAVPDLGIRIASEGLKNHGHAAADAVLVLAAHGSAKHQAPAAAARSIEQRIAGCGIFGEVRLGFVEEEPGIATAASGISGRPAACLPLFATTAGHVTGDVPQQLAAAGFRGILLPPVGEDAAVAGLIARALRQLPENAS